MYVTGGGGKGKVEGGGVEEGWRDMFGEPRARPGGVSG